MAKLMFDSTIGPFGALLGGIEASGMGDDAHRVIPAVVVQPVTPVCSNSTPKLWISTDFVLEDHSAYVVKGLVAPGDVGAILGQPGAGKSTLAPHLGYAVARGLPFFGMRTRKGRVLYLAAEDQAGVKRRVFALGEEGGHTLNLAVLAVGNLRELNAVAAVMAAVTSFQPTLVILDTMAAAFAGMDENSSADMGSVVAFSRAIANTGVAVLLVAHPAKAADGGNSTARGHGSLNGTLDMSLVLTVADVTNPSELVQGRLAKNRNGTTAKAFAFKKSVIVLGQDAEGDDITTTLPVEVSNTYTQSDIKPDTIRAVQEIVAKGHYRRDRQSNAYVGNAIGNVLGHNVPLVETAKRLVEADIVKMVSQGWLIVVSALDENRKPKDFVAVGKKAEVMLLPTGVHGLAAPLRHPAPPLGGASAPPPPLPL